MKYSLKHLLDVFVLGFVILLLLCLKVQAQTDNPNTWNFQIAPYAWLAGQNGQVATLPGLPPADIDIDFYDDIFGNINGALMLVGEARKENWGVMADIVYTDIELENSTPGLFYSALSSRTKSWLISASVLYRLIQQKKAFLDLTLGGRYWDVDSELTLKGGLLRQRRISNREDWLDPMVGLKGLIPLGNSDFYLSGFFSLGGFGVGSDFMWDATLNIGYQWTKGFATTLGYRYLDVDYEKDKFKYDVAQQGVILGFSWRF